MDRNTEVGFFRGSLYYHKRLYKYYGAVYNPVPPPVGDPFFGGGQDGIAVRLRIHVPIYQRY